MMNLLKWTQKGLKEGPIESGNDLACMLLTVVCRMRCDGDRDQIVAKIA